MKGKKQGKGRGAITNIDRVDPRTPHTPSEVDSSPEASRTHSPRRVPPCTTSSVEARSRPDSHREEGKAHPRARGQDPALEEGNDSLDYTRRDSPVEASGGGIQPEGCSLVEEDDLYGHSTDLKDKSVVEEEIVSDRTSRDEEPHPGAVLRVSHWENEVGQEFDRHPLRS